MRRTMDSMADLSLGVVTEQNRNQYESDDEESDVIIYGEHKNSMEVVIPGDINEKLNIMSITDQHGLTYDVNGIITDGIRKYDRHFCKCYHCRQQMELNDQNWYECKFCYALQQKYYEEQGPYLKLGKCNICDTLGPVGKNVFCAQLTTTKN
jgi:hypothetical protein